MGIKESFMREDENKGLMASNKDWILLDGSVKDNFKNSINYNWYERFLSLIEEEQQYLCL